MATVAKTMRHCLLNYPSIFPCPLAVSVHWFSCIGNGMEWVDGELVHSYANRDAGNTMKYDDLDERSAMVSKAAGKLPDRFTLVDGAYRIMRKYVEDNIDTICNETATLRLFDYRPTSYYYTEGVCIEYARGLNVPDNITKDWAQAVYDFIKDWKVALRQKYGVGEIETLPTEIQKVFARFNEVERTIYPVLYGRDYDTVIAQRKALFESL